MPGTFQNGSYCSEGSDHKPTKRVNDVATQLLQLQLYMYFRECDTIQKQSVSRTIFDTPIVMKSEGDKVSHPDWS